MKRLGAGLLLLATLATPAFSQESGDVRSVSWWLDRWATGLHVPREAMWTVVIALNLAVLVWFLYKVLFRGSDFSVPQFLKARGESIHQRIAEAEQAHQEAVARLAAAEARIAGLPGELQRLAAEAQSEAEREFQAVLQEAEQESSRLTEQARLEIEIATRQAQRQLKNFAATLALELAEKRIREHMTPEADRALVGQVIEELARGGRPA